MKSKGLNVFILFFAGMLVCSFIQAKATKSRAPSHAAVIITSSGPVSGHKSPCDSPFIRFHHGISESNVSVASEHISVIAFKPVKFIPEKFAGIVDYISSVYVKIPADEVFLYSRPVRSPPVFC